MAQATAGVAEAAELIDAAVFQAGSEQPDWKSLIARLETHFQVWLSSLLRALAPMMQLSTNPAPSLTTLFLPLVAPGCGPRHSSCTRCGCHGRVVGATQRHSRPRRGILLG